MIYSHKVEIFFKKDVFPTCLLWHIEKHRFQQHNEAHFSFICRDTNIGCGGEKTDMFNSQALLKALNVQGNC